MCTQLCEWNVKIVDLINCCAGVNKISRCFMGVRSETHTKTFVCKEREETSVNEF